MTVYLGFAKGPIDGSEKSSEGRINHFHRLPILRAHPSGRVAGAVDVTEMYEQQIGIGGREIRFDVAHRPRAVPSSEPSAGGLRVVERAGLLQRLKLRLAVKGGGPVSVCARKAEHGTFRNQIGFCGRGVFHSTP